MILPYYNCLLVEETLKNRKQVPTRILVSSLEERNSSLVLRMRNIMHMLITSLAIEVHELSNSYTQSQQTKQFYDALR